MFSSQRDKRVFTARTWKFQKLVGLFSRWYRSSFVCAGKWCTTRREWPSPADARAAAANDARRGVLYSSVFLGSPGEYNGTSPQDSSLTVCSGVRTKQHALPVCSNRM